MEYRKLVSEAHLMVQMFLQTQGYTGALQAFEQEAQAVLEDIPKSTPTPKPLLEVLTDIRMAQLHSQFNQLNMPNLTEEQDFATLGDCSRPDTEGEVIRDLHSVNIIFARTAQVKVAPAWQDLEHNPSMTSKFVPALITAAADRTIKFTLLQENSAIIQNSSSISTAGSGSYGDDQPGQVFRILQPHEGVALDIDFHPTYPELMLTSAMDKTVVLTNTISSEEHQKFKDHLKFVVRAKFAMGGDRIVTGSHDKTVNIYRAVKDHGQDADAVEQLPKYVLDKTLTFKGAVESICVLPWSSTSLPSSSSSSETSNDATVVIGTRDDNYLHYVSLSDYSVVKHNMNTNKDDWVSFTPMEISVSPHNDGGYLLVSTDSPTGRQILFRVGTALQLFNYYGVPTDGFSTPRHVWDRSGKYFYVTGNDHKIYCFQVNGGDGVAAAAAAAGGQHAIVSILEGHTSVVRGLYMDEARNMLVSCGFDKTVRTWIHGQDGNAMLVDH
ncbi:hypothetical protein EDD11_010217 [Mortierella claussenii]|nr:hypothetical protein EDD11_010217 [Mortierella claussenii]